MNSWVHGKWVGVLFLAAPLVASGASFGASWDGKLMEATSGAFIRFEDLRARVSLIPDGADIVLGEKHDTASIQEAQARAIRIIGQGHSFSLGWEFLNAGDQPQIRELFERFRDGRADAMDLIRISQGGSANLSYLPILDAVRDEAGELLGVNLTREQKAPVVQSGLAAADPSLIPPGFELGTRDYYERFVETMLEHSSPEEMGRYYEAQCLTDDVMAYHMEVDSSRPLRFLVTGGFHSDYRGGVVHRLEKRAPGRKVVVVRFIDASDYTGAELRALAHDPKHGWLADFIYFAGEPSQE